MDWRETRYCSQDSVFFLGVAAQRFASPSPPGQIYSKTEERHEGKYVRKRALKMLNAFLCLCKTHLILSQCLFGHVMLSFNLNFHLFRNIWHHPVNDTPNQENNMLGNNIITVYICVPSSFYNHLSNL